MRATAGRTILDYRFHCVARILMLIYPDIMRLCMWDLLKSIKMAFLRLKQSIKGMNKNYNGYLSGADLFKF